ncbi:hypothetical protein NE237_027174 [Protea cynaroides]|uniref:Uncharacterized protein n=1 Tax=Protea cynaroides TaxID=273540 RepID=A0A9Q0JSY0_9MAGN|nr:hypothetical protein NE237_027174 [Protea cynaroides]
MGSSWALVLPSKRRLQNLMRQKKLCRRLWQSECSEMKIEVGTGSNEIEGAKKKLNDLCGKKKWCPPTIGNGSAQIFPGRVLEKLLLPTYCMGSGQSNGGFSRLIQ